MVKTAESYNLVLQEGGKWHIFWSTLGVVVNTTKKKKELCWWKVEND